MRPAVSLRWAALACMLTTPAHAGDIFGTWMRGDNAARVTIAPCGNHICATNVWIRDPAGQNEKAGDKLVFQISQKDGGWSGTANDPQRGLNFDATLQAEGNSMTTRGCMLAGMACKTTHWTRQ
ncbi:MAG: DUF2147 domain-containing protein [Pseudolabrys sp.]|nr:DUF2147 domain-containing protein [Pseudolabrys sp.]